MLTSALKVLVKVLKYCKFVSKHFVIITLTKVTSCIFKTKFSLIDSLTNFFRTSVSKTQI